MRKGCQKVIQSCRRVLGKEVWSEAIRRTRKCQERERGGGECKLQEGGWSGLCKTGGANVLRLLVWRQSYPNLKSQSSGVGAGIIQMIGVKSVNPEERW